MLLSDATDCHTGASYSITSSIQEDLIPDKAIVVFDWDNTLKVINAASKRIESRVTPEFLRNLREVKCCDLYIISAIRPSRINLETLLLEVDRLKLREFFKPRLTDPSHDAYGFHDGCEGMEVQEGRYASWGNIIICGYDKAEIFLEFLAKRKQMESDEVDTAHSPSGKNEVEVTDCALPENNVTERNEKDRKVIFFDDELPNVQNFSVLVSKSKCYLVQ